MEGAALAFLIGLCIISFLVGVWILRWMLRVDHICTRLDQTVTELMKLNAAKEAGK